MKNNGIWLLPVKLILFLLIQSFNTFILLAGYSYLHPSFSTGYLNGKAQLFEGFWFPTGLFLHAFSAPFALLIISLLVIFRIEKNPSLHRLLGKTALLLVGCLVVPSGWILSYYAMGGVAGKFLFFLLSSYTGYAALQAYQCARKRQFDLHKNWMHEVFALLLSAILLRLLLVLFISFRFTGDTAYITAAILSWIPSILLLKTIQYYRKSQSGIN